MNIIITGATGSLGATLVRHLHSKGHTIIALGQTDFPPTALLKLATYIQQNIKQPFELPAADVCIHAAAVADDNLPYKQLYESNVTGSENVVKAALHCKKFIHISSSGVYLPAANPVSEYESDGINVKKLSAYGRSKLESEKAISDHFQQESLFILRPKLLYGPGDKMILPRMMRMVKNNVFQVPGKLENSISLTHYKNFCLAVDLCLQSESKGTHVYNVSDTTVYRFIDAIRVLLKAVYGIDLPEKQISIQMLKILSWFHIRGISKLMIRNFTNNSLLDLRKIETELNYKPKTDLFKSSHELSEWITYAGGPDVIKNAGNHLAWKI